MRGAGHVSHTGQMVNARNMLVGKPEGEGQFGYVGVDGRMKY
jgi:hypothetical protein